MNIAEKILRANLVKGKIIPGEEIGVRIDQTLTHDVTGTMAYLGFECLDIPRVKAETSVSYVDHNLLQGDFKNMDDHKYLQSVAKKYGIHFSRAGNGICHTVHFHRFGIPGKTLLGSDSHTPTGGAIGMLCFGAGGLDVAMAMAGEPFFLKMPQIVNVNLRGRRKPGVSAKDIILEVLRRISVKGGVGKILEYSGPGVDDLDISERSTVACMGAETGATTSIFPSDEKTKEFFRAQKREGEWAEIKADPDAEYAEVIDIDLSGLESLIACPDMPDNVARVRDLPETKVDQVFIGSCTNASYGDLVKTALILDGKTVHPDVSLSISVGTRQVLEMLVRDGYLQKLVASGARVMECGCGACVGIGQAPNSGGVSVRTSNRNFKGRSGTFDAKVYITSPEVAAATAVKGYISSPEAVIDVKNLVGITDPLEFIVDDRMIISPEETDTPTEIYKGPNIQPMPMNDALPEIVKAEVVMVLGDNVTTDDIVPAGATFSSLRSNVPAISQIVFGRIDPEFRERMAKAGQGVVMAGENYGQGSSREHAALAPMYLGVKAIIAKSFARIHKANLINYGILPLEFVDGKDLEKIKLGDILVLPQIRGQIVAGHISIKNETGEYEIKTRVTLSERETEILLAGGQLAFARSKSK